MSEQMVFRLCFQDEVQDFRAAESVVQYAERGIVGHQDVGTLRNILVSYPAVS